MFTECKLAAATFPFVAAVTGMFAYLLRAIIPNDDHEAASGATQFAILRAPGQNEVTEGHNTKKYPQKEMIDGQHN